MLCSCLLFFCLCHVIVDANLVVYLIAICMHINTQEMIGPRRPGNCKASSPPPRAMPVDRCSSKPQAWYPDLPDVFVLEGL